LQWGWSREQSLSSTEKPRFATDQPARTAETESDAPDHVREARSTMGLETEQRAWPREHPCVVDVDETRCSVDEDVCDRASPSGSVDEGE
jgi:hypothetical protein